MMKQQYGLLAFPFLVLKLPLIGPGLTEAKSTGYDMRGKLCSRLGRKSVAMLYKQRQERAREARAGKAKAE